MRTFTKFVQKNCGYWEFYHYFLGKKYWYRYTRKPIPLVVKLLKNSVSTLEKQLIDFLLHEKVENKPNNTSITGEVSKDDIQLDKKSVNPRLTNSKYDNKQERVKNYDRKEERVKTVATGNSMAIKKGLLKTHNIKVKNHPGVTSGDTLDKADDLLRSKPDCLLFQVGTNNIANKVNLLRKQ